MFIMLKEYFCTTENFSSSTNSTGPPKFVPFPGPLYSGSVFESTMCNLKMTSKSDWWTVQERYLFTPETIFCWNGSFCSIFIDLLIILDQLFYAKVWSSAFVSIKCSQYKSWKSRFSSSFLAIKWKLDLCMKATKHCRSSAEKRPCHRSLQRTETTLEVVM